MNWRVVAMLAAGLGGLPQVTLPPSLPSLPGQLDYVAHWRMLDAGTASLRWTMASGAGGGSRTIQFSADASGLVGVFYPVRDRMQSTYDGATFCTSTVHNQTLEGRRHRDTHIQYQPSQHRLQLDEFDLNHKPPLEKKESKPIPGCVFDLFTALDYARAQPLVVGDSYTFPVNEGGGTEQVRLSVDLQETVVTPAGKFACVRTQPEVFGTVFQRKGEMWIWFTDDERHLPVQVEAKVGWGTILAQLAAPPGPR